MHAVPSVCLYLFTSMFVMFSLNHLVEKILFMLHCIRLFKQSIKAKQRNIKFSLLLVVILRTVVNS